MTLSRRSLITGLGAIICAPAIVRASSLMPVKVVETCVHTYSGTYFCAPGLVAIRRAIDPATFSAMWLEDQEMFST